MSKAFACLLLFLALEASWCSTAEAVSVGKAMQRHRKRSSGKPRRSLLEEALSGTANLVKKERRKRGSVRIHHAESEEEQDDGMREEPVVTSQDVKDDEAEDLRATKKRGVIFLVSVALVILAVTLIAFGITNINEKTSFFDFMQLQHSMPLNIIVGMSSGLVFGFIDNFGLFFGMEYLDPFFVDLWKGTEKNMSAGYGNTFSDLIGSFLGTFMGKIVFELARMGNPDLKEGEYPIWTEAVGITVGCILGVVIPRLILGDPDEVVMSKAAASALGAGVTQEQIDEVMAAFDRLDVDKEGKVPTADLVTNTEDNINSLIASADLNGDGFVDREEVLRTLRIATQKAARFREEGNALNREALSRARNRQAHEHEQGAHAEEIM